MSTRYPPAGQPANRQPTPAQLWTDAVWAASPDDLTTAERLVALAYGDHAGRGDTAWVVSRRLAQRCGFKSNGTATRVVRALCAKGWLYPVGPATRHRQVIVYKLTLPPGTAPLSGTVTDQPHRSSGQSTRDVPLRSSVRLRTETAPIHEPTAPIHGPNRTDPRRNRTDHRDGPHRSSVPTLGREDSPKDSLPRDRTRPAAAHAAARGGGTASGPHPELCVGRRFRDLTDTELDERAHVMENDRLRGRCSLCRQPFDRQSYQETHAAHLRCAKEASACVECLGPTEAGSVFCPDCLGDADDDDGQLRTELAQRIADTYSLSIKAAEMVLSEVSIVEDDPDDTRELSGGELLDHVENLFHSGQFGQEIDRMRQSPDLYPELQT